MGSIGRYIGLPDQFQVAEEIRSRSGYPDTGFIDPQKLLDFYGVKKCLVDKSGKKS